MLAASRSLLPLLPSAIIICCLTIICIVQCDIHVPSINASYPERIASFGPSFPEPLGIDGYLIPIESFYPESTATQNYRKACQSLPTRPLLDRPWFALVERGSCAFVDKVRAMQHSGAAAVIVGDMYPSGPLITMYASGDTSDVLIPSVFVAKWESDVLRALALKNSSNPHPRPHHPGPRLWITLSATNSDYEELSFLSLLLLAILAPCALLFVIYTLWQWRSGEMDALRAHHGRQHDQSMRVASPEMVAQLPKVPYALHHHRHHHAHTQTRTHDDLPSPDTHTHPDPDSDIDDTTCSIEPDLCAICLESFIPEELLRQLPCHHLFHIHCIDPWLLTRRRTCPICKSDISHSLPVSTFSSTSSLFTSDLSDSDEPRSESDPLLETNIDIQALNIQRYLQMSRSGSRRNLRSALALIPNSSSPPSPTTLPSDQSSFASIPGSAPSTLSTSHEDFQECKLDL